jgi:hypothetical protein
VSTETNQRSVMIVRLAMVAAAGQLKICIEQCQKRRLAAVIQIKLLQSSIPR